MDTLPLGNGPDNSIWTSSRHCRLNSQKSHQIQNVPRVGDKPRSLSQRPASAKKKYRYRSLDGLNAGRAQESLPAAGKSQDGIARTPFSMHLRHSLDCRTTSLQMSAALHSSAHDNSLAA